MFNVEQIKHLKLAANDFVYFTNHIFAKGVRGFVGGEYIDDMCRLLSQNKRTIRVSARGHCKCVPHYTPVIMATGDEIKVSDLVVGDVVKTQHGFNPIEYITNTGKKNCYKMHLESGNSIDCSEDHRILTENGYKEAKNIEIGERIAQVAKLDFNTHKQISDDEIKLLAYLISEGGLTHSSITFTNKNNDIIDDFIKTCNNLGFEVKEAKCKDRVRQYRILGAYDWLKKFGLKGKNSHTKFIPYQVMSSPDYQVKLFIEKLWDCDGCVRKEISMHKNYGISYTSVSDEILRQLRQLLLRFGIQSNLNIAFSSYTGCNKKFRHGVLTVSPSTSTIKFAKTFKLTTIKTERLKNVFERIKDIKSQKNKIVEDNIRWLKLKEKEYIGKIECYDFEVANEHNYLINGVVVHNSFLLYSHFMYKLMYEGASRDYEAHYFSFNENLASYHISKLKKCIRDNPYFKDCKDLKPTAESVLKYTWDGEHETTLTPHGLIQFKRGLHCDLAYVDDPFQDPQNDLNPTIIYKINEIFKSNILDMPHADGELHCCGTSQTDEDFFFDKTLHKQFATKILPAISVDEHTGEEKALWPEWRDLEWLRQKRELQGKRVFSREYLCVPAYSTKAFFDKDEIKKHIVNDNISNISHRTEYKPRGQIVAGYDIGKKAHPAHIAVFEFFNNKLVLIHERWMDGWNYSNGLNNFNSAIPTQLEYVKLLIQNFKIEKVLYDNTRGEFEIFDEQRLLPRQMYPIVLNGKMKSSMATALDKLIEKRQIEIINNRRTIDQLCAVTNTLQCAQSKDGHGEPFTTFGLAAYAVADSTSKDELDGEVRREVKTGGKSLFSSSTPIPSGW